MSSETRHFFVIEAPDPVARERVARRLRTEFDASAPSASEGHESPAFVSFAAPLASGKLASFREHAARLERLEPAVRIHVLAVEDAAGPILARTAPGRGRIPAGRGVFLEAVGSLEAFASIASAPPSPAPASDPATDADTALDALLARPDVRRRLSNA